MLLSANPSILISVSLLPEIGRAMPCAYEVKVKTGLQQLRKDLKESLQRLSPTARDTI